MAFLRTPLLALVLVLVTSTAAATTANLTTYMPQCAQSCIQSSADSACAGPSDSQCLCSNMRRVGFGSLSCAQGACSGNAAEQIASELRSAYTKYCNDVGVTPSEGTWSPSGFPGGRGGSPTGMNTVATSSATTVPTPSTTPPGNSQQSAEDTEDNSGGGNSELSRGAIAGIAVGGAVASIAIAGGLFFLAFRLGEGYRNRKNNEAPRDPGQQEEGSGGGGGGGDSNITGDTTTSKAQLDGMPVNELATEYTLGELDPIKELPTQEQPVELSSEPYPRDEESPVLPQVR